MHIARYLLLFILPVSAALNLYGQSSRFHTGITVSTALTFLRSGEESLDGGSGTAVGVGLSVFYEINSRWHLVSGLAWEMAGITGRDYGPTFNCDIDPMTGIDPFNSYFAYHDKVHYLVVPAEVRLFLSRNTTRAFFLQAGATGQFKIGVSADSQIIECEMERDAGSHFNPFYGAHVRGTLGPGYRMRFRQFSATLQPYVQYSLNSVLQQFANPRMLNLALRAGVEF